MIGTPRFSVALALGLALAACGNGGGGGAISATPTPVPSPSPSPSPTPSPTPGPRLIFADEFNAGALDRTKWNVVGPEFSVNNEQQAYVDSTATIAFANPPGADGGALVLRPAYQPGYVSPGGRKADFLSGRLESGGKFDFTYGRAEARIRMPDAAGAWPAFWMLGYGDWPDAGEIDIMEYVGVKGWTSSAMHGPGYSGNTPLVKRQDFPAGQDATGWHVYSVVRKPDSVTFYVDAREVYQVSRAMVEAYGVWRFDRPEFLILNFALGGSYPNGVNGVTAPYFGLPQATVDAVARGEVAMEVDWVRVWSE